MGAGSVFDPIKAVKSWGLGDYKEQSVGDIPDTNVTLDGYKPAQIEKTFDEGESANIRKNVTKKRLGTRQANIPLNPTSVNKE